MVGGMMEAAKVSGTTVKATEGDGGNGGGSGGGGDVGGGNDTVKGTVVGVAMVDGP